MIEHEDILRKAIDVLERLNLRYMIVGSFASSFYGEPRTTIDVDIVVDIPYGSVTSFCESFPSPEFYIEPDTVRQAIRTGGQFNLIQTTTADKIDFMSLQYGTHREGQLDRRQLRPLLDGCDAYVAHPEDVILAKMEYYKEGGSEKHLRDIAGIMRISSGEVDRDYIVQWAEKLGLMEVWTAALRRLAKGQGGNSSGDD